jgi:hypothetical protein
MMRQIGWIIFQLALSGYMFSIYANDPNLDMKKWGGMAAIASFLIAGIATMALIGLFDLLRRLRVRASRRLQDQRARDVVGAKRLGVGSRHFPPQRGVGRVSQDVKDLM